ncbi:hypothetical protein [Pseudomonas serbica]|jgi:hypothetical protein|uniref:hypothetical protein n=1 Tax=Pseudomonas serbica TaxID=2965074 RepID=UPI00237B810B|nr:hypothetical protein [Pseudomonas serbica]
MLPQPQHPIHYVFGVVSHAPSVFEAWVHESLKIKLQYHFLYLAFFFYVGYSVGGVRFGIDLAGIGVMATFLMALPSHILSPKPFSLELLSDAYFNAVLAFHGFFLTYFVLFNILSLPAHYFGFFTLGYSNALISLSMALIVGYSQQMAVTTNHKVNWLSVPLISIGLAYGMFSALSTATP